MDLTLHKIKNMDVNIPTVMLIQEILIIKLKKLYNILSLTYRQITCRKTVFIFKGVSSKIETFCKRNLSFCKRNLSIYTCKKMKLVLPIFRKWTDFQCKT